ncbi:MAG: hypothetical protein RSA65_08220, partial [Clostridia bacterium]
FLSRPSDARHGKPAQQGELSIRRRRMDRNSTEPAHTEQPTPIPAAPPAGDMPAFDPFTAGDSEMNKDGASTAAHLGRREAVPGGRYTGARTAMPSDADMPEVLIPPQEMDAVAPQEGMPARQGRSMPPQNRPVSQRPVAQNRPMGQPPMPQGRPAQPPMQQGQRPMPQGQPPQGRRPAPQGQPMPQGPRPMGQRQPVQGQRPPQRPVAVNAEGVTVDENGLPLRKQMPSFNTSRRAACVGGGAKHARKAARPQASVERAPYDFEDDDQNEERQPRRGRAWLTIVIVLAVLGGLMAGLCLPNWDSLGVAPLASAKKAVVTVFENVKGMIMPDEAPIKSFDATASEAAAPSNVIFTVQTSKSAMGIRIADDQGNTVYSRTYSPDLAKTGEVIENSKVLIWTPSYALQEAYSGSFTVYAAKKDGTESEGVRSATAIDVSAPVVIVPPVQSFVCDTEAGQTPARVGFTLVTSMKVAAVRVVDQHNTPVISMYATDAPSEDASMLEKGETREWKLFAAVNSPYSGSYIAQYQTEDGDLNFIDSGYSVFAELSAASIPQPQPADNGQAGTEDSQADQTD